MRAAPWSVLLLLAMMVGALQIHPLHDADLWWHLVGGREVLAQRTWMLEDHTSFLQDGWTWENAEWLFQVVLWSAWRVAGANGVILLVAATAAASVLAVGGLALQLAPARPWAAVGGAALVVAACMADFTPRPQLAYLVLIPFTLVLLNGEFTRARVGVLAGIGLVWAHLHGSHVLLPALAACRAADDLQARRSVVPAGGVVLLLGAIAWMLGPLGPGVVSEVRDHAGTEAARMIVDMGPPHLVDWMPRTLDPVAATWAVLTLTVGRLVFGGPVRAGDLLRAGLGLALALTALRFRSAAALLTLPLLLRGLPGPEGRLGRLLGLVVGVAAAPAVGLALARAHPFRQPGVGTYTADLPVQAADVLAVHGKGGRLYNAYADGGYLAFRLAPAVKITIDGRTPTFFDPRHFGLAMQARVSPRTFAAVIEAWKVDWALLPRDHLACAALRDTEDWRVVSADDRRLLLTRTEALPGVDLRALAACGDEADERGACADAARVDAVLTEADTLASLGGHAYAALARLRLLGCAGAPDAAVIRAGVPAALTLELRGDDLDRAARLVADSDPARAIALLDLAPDAEDHAPMVATIQERSGDLRGAATTWARHAARKGPELPAADRVAYARVLAAAGRPAAAAEQARRAAWAGRPEAITLLSSLLPQLSEEERRALTPYLPPP